MADERRLIQGAGVPNQSTGLTLQHCMGERAHSPPRGCVVPVREYTFAEALPLLREDWRLPAFSELDPAGQVLVSYNSYSRKSFYTARAGPHQRKRLWASKMERSISQLETLRMQQVLCQTLAVPANLLTCCKTLRIPATTTSMWR